MCLERFMKTSAEITLGRDHWLERQFAKDIFGLRWSEIRRHSLENVTSAKGLHRSVISLISRWCQLPAHDHLLSGELTYLGLYLKLY